MHDTFFFIRQLSSELHSRLSQKKLIECFSQNKDEIVMGFVDEKEEFWLKAAFLPKFCLLSFPADFQRAKKNTVDLFVELIGQTVFGIGQFENERAFWIEFSGAYDLVFKLFGNKSNLILYHNKTPSSLFRKKFVQDLSLQWDKLNRPEEYTSLKNSYLISRQMRDYMEAQPEHDIEKALFEPEGYFITDIPQLWLFEPKNQTIVHSVDSSIQAAHVFYEYFIRSFNFQLLKNQTLQYINNQISRTQSYLSEGYERLTELQVENPHEKAADLLMAYLHAVPQGSKEVEFADFETSKPVKIKLNDKLSPQKNAEHLYKKAKNRRLEVESLEKGIAAKEAKLFTWQQHLQAVLELQDHFALSKYVKNELSVLKKEELDFQPFHTYTFLDFTVLVGKNAKGNDQLFKLSSKGDLWLHVRDAKGSHVIVRQVPGKTFPKAVVERAAQLAAYYSERRNDSLCAVIYTPRKFVRKRKGGAPGEVVVEKEQVVLVLPQGLETL